MMKIDPATRIAEGYYNPLKPTIQPRKFSDRLKEFSSKKNTEKNIFHKCWEWMKGVFFAIFSWFFPAKKKTDQINKTSSIPQEELLKNQPPFLDIKLLKSACKQMEFCWKTQSQIKIKDNADGEEYQLHFEIKQDGSILVSGTIPKHIASQIKEQLLNDERNFQIAPETMVSAFYDVSMKEIQNGAYEITCQNPFDPSKQKMIKLIPFDSDFSQNAFLFEKEFWEFPKAAQRTILLEAGKLKRALFFMATETQVKETPFLMEKRCEGLYKLDNG